MSCQLYQLAPQTHTQMMGYVLQTDDALIVLDGGTAGDAPFLRELLHRLGGAQPHITAWFLTHPHHDHVGAFVALMEGPDAPVVEQVYHCFPSRQLLEKGDAPVVTAAKAAGGVRIMSVHKSKGLEFPVVILADLCRAFNRQDMDRPVLVHPQLGVGAERVEVERRLRYDTISKTALALVLEREAKAEELRILYVAMTRAQEKLIMVCSRKNPEKHLRELCAQMHLNYSYFSR